MKVGFTGTQKGLTSYQVLELQKKLHIGQVLVHGGCIGADDQADMLAVLQHMPRIVRPSNIAAKSIPAETLRARANKASTLIILPEKPPLERNHDIVDTVEWLIACPAQKREVLRSGTWATIRYARKKLGESKILIIYP